MTPWQERFWSKVDMANLFGCWEWRAYRRPDGYGVFNTDHSRPLRAHRVAYELVVGPIPAGLTVDHLCRNRGCVNPAHLEPVTMKENTLRGMSSPATRARQTHCKNGHPLSGGNLRIDKFGRRRCRRCKTDWQIAKDRETGRIR